MKKKYSEFFETENFASQLKRKAIRGGFVTMAAQLIQIVLRTLSIVILARMLMPEDFGLVGMVTAVILIAQYFKDLGLSAATMQIKDINHEQASFLFWINTGFGLLLTSTIAGLAWLIAWFYGDQRLVGITLAISISFLFGGLTVQHDALLRRQMRFRKLSLIRIASEGLSFAIAVGMAWLGFKYWSLVAKEIARSVFLAAGTWIMCRWLPSMPKKVKGLGSMLRFGRDISGFNIVIFLTRNLDQILIGKFLGAAVLGFYRQAYQMIAFPIQQIQTPINAVALPVLSRLQGDPEKFSRYCEKIVSLLSFVSIPLMIYFIIYSDELIRLLLGEKWIESASIMRIFAISGIIGPATMTSYAVMVSSGKTVRLFWFGVMSSIMTVIAVSIGIFWGSVGVASALTIRAYVWFIPSLLFSYSGTPASVKKVLTSMIKPAFSGLSMAVLLVLTSTQISNVGSLEIPFTIVLGFISYCGVWLLLPGGKDQLKEYISYPLMAMGLRGK